MQPLQTSRKDSDSNLPPAPANQNNLLDSLISKLGYGAYQYKALFFISLTNLNEGAENIVLSFLVSILSREWGVTAEMNSALGSTIWLGFLLGSFLSGPIADRFGRKKPLNYCTLLLYFFAMMCSFANSFTFLIIMRSIYGLLAGFQTPLCLTYLAEIAPKEIRGKVLILAGASFTVGQLYACFLAFFTLESTSQGDWRTLLLWVAQPTIISWIGINFFLDESPRYEIMVKKDIQAGVDILEKMAKANNLELSVTENQKEQLREAALQNEAMHKKEDAGGFAILFNKENRSITLHLWPMWFVVCLVSYGTIYILPLTISAISQEQTTSEEGGNSGLWDMVFAILGEIPAITAAYFIIEKDLFGRRKTMIIGFIITAIAGSLAYSSSGFIFWVTIARGVSEAVFLVIFPYTLELYPTLVRVTGLGMASSFARFGGIIMPWFTLLLYEISPKLPYFGFAILSVIAVWCGFKLKLDTTQKELDCIEMQVIH